MTGNAIRGTAVIEIMAEVGIPVGHAVGEAARNASGLAVRHENAVTSNPTVKIATRRNHAETPKKTGKRAAHDVMSAGPNGRELMSQTRSISSQVSCRSRQTLRNRRSQRQ